MAAFFAKTWFLWWMVAVVIVMRWFHVAGVNELEEQTWPAWANDEGSVLSSGRVIEVVDSATTRKM